MSESDPLRAHLIGTDDEFRRLSAQHQQLDVRLRELASQLSHTANEEQEHLILKKRKLQLKDRMGEMIRQYREASEASPSPALQPHPRS